MVPTWKRLQEWSEDESDANKVGKQKFFSATVAFIIYVVVV